MTMALFVFGAGATRGANFVSASTNPCLPPLDRDFFTQLQRIGGTKHRDLVRSVMADVVEVFGLNFDVTMETMFTTLEHTIRMLETTGENRAFKKSELRQKRERLVQAIAAALEESCTEKSEQGGSKHNLRHCEFHDRFVDEILLTGDDIISLNYDCVLDDSLRRCGSHKWNAKYGYGINLGPRSAFLVGHDNWQPSRPAEKDSTVHLYKLHGSIHFHVSAPQKRVSMVTLKQHPYTRRSGNLRFTIIPPEWHKTYDVGFFSKLWHDAATAIHRAKQIVIVGYSMPATDLHSNALFRTSIRKEGLEALVVVNPKSDTRRRIRTALQRGLAADTKVLSVDSMKDFVALDRKTWMW